ncbi:aspartate ammonia-lyase [Weissella uvarum]|uniref:aspartate ammonia-lyase n=1 Tax=Weissella uvarum TaxID=1479233 RepID=UPI00196039C4|nr:aspartate ammonia-lyase [Weissella uvarum]MBM7617324.1 aspartate ammonia-lyase [Weissella uvarum]MCM0595191.1 aspartate ammonia-lyase [Weissella uvarum]
MRVESDSLGQVEVPDQAFYGVHTVRALENFPITGEHVNANLIKALIQIKLATIKTNHDAGNLDDEVAGALIEAANQVLSEPIDYENMFPLDPIQGGAGTSMNMNANEVLANLALTNLGYEKGDYQKINPNDHVNKSQSTNDVFPSAGKLALIHIVKPLMAEINALMEAMGAKADEFADIYKMGRTQLQDAVPMTLGNSFHAYLKPLGRDLMRIDEAQQGLHVLNLGGSAIGSGINVSRYYQEHIIPELNAVTGLELEQASDLFDATQNLDGFLQLSSALKSLAVDLSKIANDLRLLSSGPRSGLNEINLPARQAGSSIMPGKVNPVIPEVLNQVAFEVMGNDITVTSAVEGGQLELNAFEPVMLYRLFASIEHLTQALKTFREHAIVGITPNEDRLAQDIDLSVSYATAMAAHIGYKEASNLAKEALRTNRSLRDLAEDSGEFTEEELEDIFAVDKIVRNARTPEHGLTSFEE